MNFQIVNEYISKLFNEKNNINQPNIIEKMENIIKNDSTELSSEFIKIKLKQLVFDTAQEDLDDLINEYDQNFLNFNSDYNNIITIIDKYKTSTYELDKLGYELIIDYDKNKANPYNNILIEVEEKILNLPIISDNCNISFRKYIKDNHEEI
ncbi:MAG: hypothetical protein LBN03_01300 [Bifidobacteriaceae bacterium]|jgi:hypothetical protein|nr:hypothetical protein [Bifidobacteriaceae bacterium]